MEGRLKEGEASREELYRARTKGAEKPRMKMKRGKRGEPKGKRRAKEISKLSKVFKGMERQDGRCG